MADMVGNINIIVAVSENNCIGVNNKLPWNLPSDLENFKELTTGHTVIMGRNTWESLPEKVRPLPNRKNIVLTKNKEYKAEGAEVRHDLQDTLDGLVWEDNEVFIIGGSQIYKEAFQYANKLHITRVMANIDGDTFLEGLEPSEWLMIGFEGPFKENEYDFRFETYKRK